MYILKGNRIKASSCETCMSLLIYTGQSDSSKDMFAVTYDDLQKVISKFSWCLFSSSLI